MKILAYNIRVFGDEWVFTAIDLYRQESCAIISSRDELSGFYRQHEDYIWVGYYSRCYDSLIVKAILAGLGAKGMHEWIASGKTGWSYSDKINRHTLLDYDTSIKNKTLRMLQGYRGVAIRILNVPERRAGRLTASDLESIKAGMLADTEDIAEVFLSEQKAFKTHVSLIKAFNLPVDRISKGQGTLISEILGATGSQHFDDELEIDTPPTLVLPEKYRRVPAWFLSTAKLPRAEALNSSLTVKVAGLPLTFGWGGVHGALQSYRTSRHMLNIDASAMYPAIMVRYGIYSRQMRDPEKFRSIYEANIRMKKDGDPLRPAMKLVSNRTYGLQGDTTSKLYDPLAMHRVCIYGQLLMLDLISKLEEARINGFKLLMVNTDGILFEYDGAEATAGRVRSLVGEWETRTGLTTETEGYKELYQGDVSNYIAVREDGSVKCKGAFVKERDELAILNRAVRDYILKGAPIRETIYSSHDLRDFQLICRVTGKYSHLVHGGRRLSEDTVRVFASRDWTDGALHKVKRDGTVSKYEGTPQSCFIINDDIRGMGIPAKLDLEWYVSEASRRLQKFL